MLGEKCRPETESNDGIYKMLRVTGLSDLLEQTASNVLD